MPSDLGDILARAAAGSPPPPDGGVTLLPPPSARDSGVLAFTAHHVVFADVTEAWLAGLLPAGDLAAPLSPAFLVALEAKLGRRADVLDLLTAAPGLAGPPLVPLTELAGSGLPRVQRAYRYRDEVRVWAGGGAAGGATVAIGRGVAGRHEVAIEVEPGCRGRGAGRRALSAARHLIPAGEPLWAQIAPGNAASVRAFLAAGFVPVGAEMLLFSPGR